MIKWEEYREIAEEGDTSWSEFNSCQIIADAIAVEIKNLEVTAQDHNVAESAIDDLEKAFECMKSFYAKMQNGKENHWNAYKNILEQNMLVNKRK